ncbi:MAG TPA: helix-turn-helix transcriptional regulator [Pseudolabrys sp.]|nr:helix-turn-helix transcriptional regulator [Pseudolabrys sp.]
MTVHVAAQRDYRLAALLRFERRAFAAKVRMSRALLGWSQSEFGARVGLTQRSIHKLERGETEPRRSTVYAIEEVWRQKGLVFEDLGDGGFRAIVRASLVDDPARRPGFDLGVTAISRRA